MLALGLGLLAAVPPAAAGVGASPPAVRIEVGEVAAAGLAQRVLYLTPPAPRGTLVMLPGGTGRTGLADDGAVAHGNNFLVRSRARFAAAGYAVVIPDAAGGRSLRGRRSTPAYAAVVAALVAFARARAERPVFLIGTSQGAIAAANGAARLAPGEIAGLVLMEAVSRRGGSGETVFDTDLKAVAVPVLVVANTDDACLVAPPQDAARIAAALAGAPAVAVASVSGGVRRGPDCGARSPHGYFGIEAAVVGVVASWLDARTR